jgi:hypothetical protein
MDDFNLLLTSSLAGSIQGSLTALLARQLVVF